MGRQWDTFKPGVEQARVVASRVVESENPNLAGRHRSPATSPSAVEYDRSLAGQRAFQQWTEQWAREVFRVLKPGGHLLVCGAPRSFHRMASGLEDAGFEVRDCLSWLFGQGFPKSHNLKGDWQGWGTALKPGWEPIVVVRKPFKGTVARNVEQQGTGAYNIDRCRIAGETPSVERRKHAAPGLSVGATGWTTPARPASYSEPHPGEMLGRWPANVVIDEEAAALLDEQSGHLTGGGNITGQEPSKPTKDIYGDRERTPWQAHGDSGGASRFFYCAKASKSERGVGNSHPTVKPLNLMRWLVRLVTPPQGLVLDPFIGSGTTGLACAAEGFRFVGIEKEAEYVAMAEARLLGLKEAA